MVSQGSNHRHTLRLVKYCAVLSFVSGCVAGGATPADEEMAAGDDEPSSGGSTMESTGGTAVVVTSGGTSTGGVGNTGGSTTGGASTGGTATGGTSTGGTSTGGASTGGTSTGGVASGGTDTGGSSTGGMANADCSGTLPVLFHDDFELGSDCWVQNTAGDWVLTNDEGKDASQGFEQAASDSRLIVATAGDGTWVDVRIEADVFITDFDGATSDDLVGLFARYQDEENFYYAGLRGNDKLHARKRVEDGNSSIGSSYVIPDGWMLSTWYRIGFEVEGSTLRMYIDGVLVDTETDTSITTGGYVGIGTVEDATVIFDNVVVTSLE